MTKEQKNKIRSLKKKFKRLLEWNKNTKITIKVEINTHWIDGVCCTQLMFEGDKHIDIAIEEAQKEQVKKHNIKITNFLKECDSFSEELGVDDEAFFFEYILGYSKEDAECMAKDKTNSIWQVLKNNN